MPRQPHPTGQQEPCTACASAGITRQGVSRAGPGSDPLCQSCWLGRQEREARAELRRQLAEVWDEVGELDTDTSCQACGAPEPVSSCWLCGYSYLAAARAEYEREQAARQVAEAALQDRIQTRTETEDRVADLTAWIERLRMVLAAFVAGRRQGRAVELVADLLARLAVTRTSSRGRPPKTPYVGAVVAADSNWQSGRRGMPGRERTAWLVGCSDRAVYDGWQRIAEVQWAKRVRIGGRNSLERRLEVGRSNDRAEFDIAQLHRSIVDPATRATYIPQALAVLGELLAHAEALLAQEQDQLDALRARTETWTDWAERVRRLQLRQAVARVQEAITDPALSTRIFCRSHTVSRGEYLSSCSYWGFSHPPKIMIQSAEGTGVPAEGRKGASRAPTTEAGQSCGSPRLQRPRTLQREGGRSRLAPEWASWAYPLARELRKRWRWLVDEPLPRVAATLGAALGPDWTVEQLVAYVRRQRHRPVLDNPARPLAYLRTLLAESMVGEQEPPSEARVATMARRADVRGQAAELRVAQAAARAGEVALAVAVVPGHTNPEVRALRQRWATRAPAEADDWPEVRRPGSGCPSPDPTPPGTGSAAPPWSGLEQPSAVVGRRSWLR